MSEKTIGPKEQQLRDLRNLNKVPRNAAKPASASDLRKKIASVKPMTKHSGRRGR